MDLELDYVVNLGRGTPVARTVAYIHLNSLDTTSAPMGRILGICVVPRAKTANAIFSPIHLGLPSAKDSRLKSWSVDLPGLLVSSREQEHE